MIVNHPFPGIDTSQANSLNPNISAAGDVMASTTMAPNVSSASIPPPASLAEVEADSLNLNDEIFFNQNTMNASTSYFNQDGGDDDDVNSNISASSKSLSNFNSYQDLHSSSSISNSNTELSSPTKPLDGANYGYGMQYTHSNSIGSDHTLTQVPADNQLAHMPSHTRHKLSFSLPIDQLNLLTLRPFSSSSSVINSSPSPDYAEPTMNGGDISPMAVANTSNNSNFIGNDSAYDTINPRQLFHDDVNSFDVKDVPPQSSLIQLKSQSKNNPPPSIALQSSSNPRNYILPSSVSSPSLTTVFKPASNSNAIHSRRSSMTSANRARRPSKPIHTMTQEQLINNYAQLPVNDTESPKFDFIMNDECFNAISYWLNNTAQVLNNKNEDPINAFNEQVVNNVNVELDPEFDLDYDNSAEILTNPTGIIKAPLHKRRNSIQVVSQFHTNKAAEHQLTESAGQNQKRKRRKSQILDSNTVRPSLLQESVSNANPNISPNLSSAPVSSNSASTANFGNAVNPHPHLYKPNNSASVKLPPTPNLADFAEQRAFTSPSTTTPVLQQQSKFDLIGRKPTTVSEEEEEEEEEDDKDIDAGPVISSTITGNTINICTIQQFDEDGQPKPFPCPDCTKVFKRSEHLKRHIRSVHSNIRPFHCKYCEKKFSRSDNLAQHLKTHYKVDENGNSTIVYGNPNVHGRGGRRGSTKRA